jgi:hypothetical protein
MIEETIHWFTCDEKLPNTEEAVIYICSGRNGCCYLA